MFFMQDRGWWNSTKLFWDSCMSLPGGLLSRTGAYLTQFFYYPALGSIMLILLWLLLNCMVLMMGYELNVSILSGVINGKNAKRHHLSVYSNKCLRELGIAGKDNK